MPLTDLKVRSLKAKTAPYKVSDSEGLYLLVTPAGGKLWRLAYRFNGKQKSFALGKYPETSLLDARKARDENKRYLRDGVDPSANRKAERRRQSIAAANTFEAVANERFELMRGRWVESYADRDSYNRVGPTAAASAFGPGLAWLTFGSRDVSAT